MRRSSVHAWTAAAGSLKGSLARRMLTSPAEGGRVDRVSVETGEVIGLKSQATCLATCDSILVLCHLRGNFALLCETNIVS